MSLVLAIGCKRVRAVVNNPFRSYTSLTGHPNEYDGGYPLDRASTPTHSGGQFVSSVGAMLAVRPPQVLRGQEPGPCCSLKSSKPSVNSRAIPPWAA
jgi:hypothetical protein